MIFFIIAVEFSDLRGSRIKSVYLKNMDVFLSWLNDKEKCLYSDKKKIERLNIIPRSNSSVGLSSSLNNTKVEKKL
jgi:hypothetical protein